MKLRRLKLTTKLDRRRERSRARDQIRSQAFDALLGEPASWPPGTEGTIRHWKGRRFVYHEYESVMSGWFLEAKL